MQVLYVSTLISQSLLQQIFKSSSNPGFAVQKFHRLLSQGLAANQVNVQTLSAVPISFNDNKKLLFRHDSEEDDGITFHHSSFINIPIIKHLCLFISAFFNVIHWRINNHGDKIVICDVLNISICMGALFATKIIGVKCIGIVTDMPGLMVGNKKSGCLSKIITAVNKSYLANFSHYIFLTEQMNEAINHNHKPFIVMEGLVDINMKAEHMSNNGNTRDKRIVMYAGSLYERYGLKMLVDAFMSLPNDDIQLSIYGNGPMENYIQECAIRDHRVKFYGTRLNEEIVAAELQATLLVNPRPTHEEFTKYSFPSKNMEYMVSGTPLLTTALPGMPKEYYRYVYLFNEESTGGYTKTLSQILALSHIELREKGLSARMFVLNNKNNHVQARRIIQLVDINI